jgi:heme-degrading monooxygenase HmoA
MYLILWKFQVKAERITEFEQMYHSEGRWAKLFRKGIGYLGTELFRDFDDHQHYITVDRWTSVTDYELFLSKWKEEYEELDAQCTGLTKRETLLGKWESVNYETR